MDSVQEGSSNSVVTVEPFTNTGAESVPDALSYKVLGRETLEDSWSELVAETAITTLSTSIDLALTPPATTFIGSGPTEYRRVCFYIDEDFWKSITFKLVESLCA